MVVVWLVIAALFYFPFKRWVATAEAPLISALLWPLLTLTASERLVQYEMSMKPQFR